MENATGVGFGLEANLRILDAQLLRSSGFGEEDEKKKNQKRSNQKDNNAPHSSSTRPRHEM